MVDNNDNNDNWKNDGTPIDVMFEQQRCEAERQSDRGRKRNADNRMNRDQIMSVR